MSTAKIIQKLLYYTRDILFHPITNLKYKASITGNTKDVNFSVLLKHLNNLLRALYMPLINCEVSLTLNWSKSCVLTDQITRHANPNAGPSMLTIRAPTNQHLK